MGPAVLLDESEHQPARIFGVNDSLKVSDKGVIERGENFGLPLKPCQPFRIVREHLRKNLDRHVAIELGVRRTIHLAHPTLTEQGDNLVVTEFVADGKRHVTDLA